MAPATFTRDAVSQWMRRALDAVRRDGADAEHAELLEGGEVDCTRLAELAAAAFGVDDVSDDPAAPAPLDDDGHWVWEVAVDVAAVFEAEGDDDAEGDEP